MGKRLLTGSPFQDCGLGSSRPNLRPTKPRRPQIPEGEAARCWDCRHLLEEPRAVQSRRIRPQEVLKWSQLFKMDREKCVCVGWGGGVPREFP